MVALRRRSEPLMPKRLLLALAVAALAIAACNNGAPSTSATYTPASPTPDPKITKAKVNVTINGTPLPKIPVEISTPKSTASPRAGKPFFTKTTGKKGNATFTGLKPSQTYCWVAVIGSNYRASECADWQIWQAGTIDLPN